MARLKWDTWLGDLFMDVFLDLYWAMLQKRPVPIRKKNNTPTGTKIVKLFEIN